MSWLRAAILAALNVVQMPGFLVGVAVAIVEFAFVAPVVWARRAALGKVRGLVVWLAGDETKGAKNA